MDIKMEARDLDSPQALPPAPIPDNDEGEEEEPSELGQSVSQPVPCSECDQAFDTHAALEEHMMCHVGDKPYECIWCAKPFAKLRTMESHAYNTHMKPAPVESPPTKEKPKKLRNGWMDDDTTWTNKSTI